ncbi:MAG: acyl-CoA synthetase [Frankiaceae bacterium]|nr:acyl-CoA synthetase [Frankiaceae bacterium]MBV9870285.1 acyl-CoA synthetase [Frankiaceae bacterium]
MPGFNLADLFERVVDAAPDREVIVSPARRLTFRELDDRANALAAVLTDLGVKAGDHIGLQLLNGSEYIEGMLAAFKLSVVPVNVNFRYVEGELRHLYTDADLVAVIHHRQFGTRVAAAADGADLLEHLISVEDGSGAEQAPHAVDYDSALAAASTARPDGTNRSGDDRYIAYTGGTTGLPKGVVWRQEDIFFAAMGGGDPFQMGNFLTTPEEIVERIPETGGTILTTPPLMHVSAQWGVFHSMFAAGRIVFPPHGAFDPDAIWSLVASEGVNILTIVGDAMAQPLADAIERASAAGKPYDVSSLIVIGSGGAVLSTTAKSRLATLIPTIMVVDGFGSSETGVVGSKLHSADDTSTAPRFMVNAQTNVLAEDGTPVVPGSGQVGRLARKGHVPLGYYKDEAKTKATFLEVGGERWVLPGDNATVDEDGTVVLLGRGSTSINTGGEKVYPEEVETALMTSPDVGDVIVVGLPDEKWGQRVVAVVQPAADAAPDLDALREHARSSLAGYKLPRELIVVDKVERTPAGKADYKWAKATAEARSTQS